MGCAMRLAAPCPPPGVMPLSAWPSAPEKGSVAPRSSDSAASCRLRRPVVPTEPGASGASTLMDRRPPADSSRWLPNGAAPALAAGARSSLARRAAATAAPALGAGLSVAAAARAAAPAAPKLLVARPRGTKAEAPVASASRWAVKPMSSSAGAATAFSSAPAGGAASASIAVTAPTPVLSASRRVVRPAPWLARLVWVARGSGEGRAGGGVRMASSVPRPAAWQDAPADVGPCNAGPCKHLEP
jgi:hypothetical protein